MAKIINRVLTLTHDKKKHAVRAIVKCDIHFNDLELCQVKVYSVRMFKLKCELWGEPTQLKTSLDDRSEQLFTFPSIYFFHNGQTREVESRLFDVTIQEALLDNELGRDQVFAKLKLYNLSSANIFIGETNIVTDWEL